MGGYVKLEISLQDSFSASTGSKHRYQYWNGGIMNSKKSVKKASHLLPWTHWGTL